MENFATHVHVLTLVEAILLLIMLQPIILSNHATHGCNFSLFVVPSESNENNVEHTGISSKANPLPLKSKLSAKIQL